MSVTAPPETQTPNGPQAASVSPGEPVVNETVQATPLGLFGKLAKIAGELDWVEKRGVNEAQKYNYVRVEDVLDAVREKLAENGIALIPEALSVSVAPTVSQKQNVTTVKMKYTLVDSESGETQQSTWFGTGADSGDKGLLKAQTAALKYYFLQLFQIPTGVDPDADGQAVERAKKGEALLPPAEVKKVQGLVAATNTPPEKWALFLTSLGVKTEAELKTGNRQAIRDWLAKHGEAEA